MSENKIIEIAKALDALSADLDALAQSGEDIPAVEKNVVRMRGALNALQIQFSDLAAIGTGT